MKEGLKQSEICEKLGISKKKLLSKYRMDFIKFIKELVSEGKNFTSIAESTGISRTTVGILYREDVNKYILTQEKIDQIIQLSKMGMTPGEIAKRFGITIDYVYDGLKNEILRHYMKLNSIEDLKLEFRIRGPIISKILHNSGLKIHNGHSTFDHYGKGKYPFFKPIRPYLKDVIIGELLGDAHIREIKYHSGKYSNDAPSTGINEYKNTLDTLKCIIESKNLTNIEDTIQKFNASLKVIENTKVTSFALSLKMESKSWVQNVGNKFKDEKYGISYYLDKANKNSIYNNQDMFRVTTKSSIQLQQFREQWYIKTDKGDNLKILPEGLRLNVNRILHWYAGDGSYSGGYVSFATDGFLEKDTRELSKLLNEEVKIDSYVNKSKINIEGEENWRIRFGSKESVDRFFEYLEGAEKKDLELAKRIFPQKFPEKKE